MDPRGSDSSEIKLVVHFWKSLAADRCKIPVEFQVPTKEKPSQGTAISFRVHRPRFVLSTAHEPASASARSLLPAAEVS